MRASGTAGSPSACAVAFAATKQVPDESKLQVRHRDVRLHERFDPATNDLARDLDVRVLDAMTDLAPTPGMIQLTARVSAEAADHLHDGRTPHPGTL